MGNAQPLAVNLALNAETPGHRPAFQHKTGPKVTDAG